MCRPHAGGGAVIHGASGRHTAEDRPSEVVREGLVGGLGGVTVLCCLFLAWREWVQGCMHRTAFQSTHPTIHLFACTLVLRRFGRKKFDWYT